jgi:hypothetical protein
MTKAQREALAWLAKQPRGMGAIDFFSAYPGKHFQRLVDMGYVTIGGKASSSLYTHTTRWVTITDAGREALR